MPREKYFDSYEAFAIETTAVVGDGALELIFCHYRRRYGGSVKCLAYNSIRLYLA